MITAFVTSSEYSNGSTDDLLLIPALQRQNLSVQHVVWCNPSVPWSSFSAVILRSCWDYHTRFPEFKEWLQTMDRHRTRLHNPADCVLWNADKTYLRELSAKGTRIPPTRWLQCGEFADLYKIMAQEGWSAAVVKPTISASAYETKLVKKETATVSQPWFHDLVTRHEVMVQKFLPEVLSTGEISLIYFQNNFSHAVCKLPLSGDFRVQDELGGSYHAIVPDNRIISWGKDLLASIDYPLLYARVDLVMISATPLLTELELIEPDLYLDTDKHSVDRFAQAIRDCCIGK